MNFPFHMSTEYSRFLPGVRPPGLLRPTRGEKRSGSVGRRISHEEFDTTVGEPKAAAKPSRGRLSRHLRDSIHTACSPHSAAFVQPVLWFCVLSLD
jgi:hypothetical protein